MADGDTVKMELTFWRDGKQPGDVIDVPADEVHRWTGFAKLGDGAEPEPEPAKSPAQPADNARVEEWRAYAVSLGMDKAKADKATSGTPGLRAKTDAGTRRSHGDAGCPP
jgi:hypothetical protein